MKPVTRLDQVFPFNQKVSFLIPHEWTEEYDDGSYLYQLPGTESGWLRVLKVRRAKSANRANYFRLDR